MPPFARPVLYAASAFVAVLLLGTAITGQQGWLLLLDNLHWTISFTAAAALGWMGVRAAGAGKRRARYWFALGLSAGCLGQWVWNVEEALHWFSMPDIYFYLRRFPAIGLAFDSAHDFPVSAFISVWLGVGFVAGLFVTLREKLDRRQMQAALLDLASMTLLILALVLAIYLPRSGNVSPTALAIMTGFPLFMLSAVSLVGLAVLHLRMRPDWPWICVLAGMGALGFLWMQWNVMTLEKALSEGSLINALFSPAMLLLGAGAMGWRVRSDTNPRFDRRCEGTLRMLPLLFVALAAISIFVVLATGNTLAAVRYAVIVSGVFILLLSVLRQRLMLAEYQRMLDSERMATESQARYEYLAKHDPLTQLPNRFHVNERLRQMMDQASGQNRSLALLLIDIDYFKNVNDSYGHTVGDALLVSIVQRLLENKRNGDILARLGSDEFALLTTHADDKTALAAYAHVLLEALRAPFLLSNDSEVFISASIGISRYPLDSGDPVQLIRNADTAMYEAKKTGRSLYHFYTFDLTTAAQERLAIDGRLHLALENREFVLHYQPQVDRYGHILGVEALLRWQRPDGKLAAPDQFIPFAEETGLIVPIGDWVLENACQQAQSWKKLGLPDLQIAVNVSARRN
jgi:diguanylate cyclase (GGDEF)-like protein